jgi:protein-tyrosine-phosphatase
MAEAYFNSKQLENIDALSSGIFATKNYDGPITWYAAKIIKENDLVPYMSHDWQQTDLELLKKTDLFIFMKDKHLAYVKQELDFDPDQFQIWNISDLNQFDYQDDDPKQQLVNEIKTTKQIFAKIKQKTDQLIERF